MIENKVIYLLEKAETLGIKISFKGDEISVKIPRLKKIDQSFLAELKESRELLYEYFRRSENQDIDFHALTQAGPYYDITSLQQWWVSDDDKEFKEKIYGLLKYKIQGRFDVNIFKNAVRFLVGRHESLRSAFCKMGDDYKMKVLEKHLPIFDVDFKDLTDIAEGNDILINNFLNFADHTFSLADGPLFLVRLIQVADQEFLLSCKIHHVIFDAWAIEVLFRDLMSAYLSFSEGKLPSLPVLRYQYKDYMHFANLSKKKSYNNHKAYWNFLYKDLPDDLIIPGEKKRASDKVSLRLCEIETFDLPTETMDLITMFSRKYSTSKFIVLQATLKSYLYKITGQNDIVMGTQVFGRDQLEGLEDQIGFYTRMCLLRTVIQQSDTFEDCIRRLIKSNDDMQRYTAFTLKDAIEELLPAGQHITGTFWKITVQYEDINGFLDKYSTQPNNLFSVTSIPRPETNKIHNIDMKLTFIMTKENVKLETVYNSELYEANVIDNFVRGYVNHLQTIYSADHVFENNLSIT